MNLGQHVGSEIICISCIHAEIYYTICERVLLSVLNDITPLPRYIRSYHTLSEYESVKCPSDTNIVGQLYVPFNYFYHNFE